MCFRLLNPFAVLYKIRSKPDSPSSFIVNQVRSNETREYRIIYIPSPMDTS